MDVCACTMHNFMFSFTRLWVEGLFLCSCKKLVAARKQMSILQAPNVLVIQLKVGYYLVSCLLGISVIDVCFFVANDTFLKMAQRFEGIFGGKVDKPIAFEEVLVLSSYMYKGSQVCFLFIDDLKDLNNVGGVWQRVAHWRKT